MPKGKKGGKTTLNQKGPLIPDYCMNQKIEGQRVKNGKRGGSRVRRNGYGSDEDSIVETCSVISNVSSEDPRSVYCDEVASLDEPDEQSQEEILEEKLIQAIDEASQKSAQGRTNCLTYLCSILTSRHLHEFVVDRYVTMADIIQRSLKRGKGKEQEAAALLAPVICIQLGAGPEREEYFAELRPIFLQLLSDDSCNAQVRARCAMSVALLTFLASEDVTELWNIINMLERLWKNPALDIENSTNADKQILIASAVSAWSLLLTLISTDTIYRTADENLRYLSQLLRSSDLNVRIAAGEAIALIYERARDFDDEFFDENGDTLCQQLQQLATDSHKYRAKKDRKQQRSCFRDVIRAVEIGESPTDSIRFGREVLEINSWCKKQQYDSFCQVLHSGMNLHLSENELLRDIFQLGSVLPSMKPEQYKASKMERHQKNMAAFKDRTLMRGKFRDKRIAVF